MKPTPEQQAVIDHEGGNALVRAVAGSGKTQTLVYRIVARLQAGADPSRILVLQFNTEARRAFAARLERALQGRSAPEVRTFHALALRMVKAFQAAGALPIAKLETDEGVRLRLIRKALVEAWKKFHGPDTWPPSSQVENFLSFLSVVNAGFDSPEAVFDRLGLPRDSRPFLGAIRTFNSLRRQARLRFFDDLLLDAVEAGIRNPDLVAPFAALDELLVDECQDINHVQYALIQMVTSRGAALIAVGDEDQAIYGWRGASVDFIQRLIPHDYATADYRLTRSFRYGHRLALAACSLITLNQDRSDKLVIAADGTPDTVIARVPLAGQGTPGLVPLILDRWGDSTLARAALLVRNFSHALPYEVELAAAGVPYHTYGREPLLWLPEVAGMVAAISLAAGRWPAPAEDRLRFFSAMLQAPTLYLRGGDINSLALAACNAYHAGEADFTAAWRQHAATLKQGQQRKRLYERADAVRMMTNPALSALPPEQLVEVWLQATDLREHLAKGAGTAEQRAEALETVNAVIAMARRAGSTDNLFDLIEPLADGAVREPPEGDHLAITSIHRFKGEERDEIFLGGWGAGSFPARGAESDEEERRLAYVAITRARHRLTIFHPADQALEDANADPAARIEPGLRNASPYLFEADLGVADRVAIAVSTGETGPLRLRNHDLVGRYLREAGLDQLQVTGDHARATRTTRLASAADAEPGMYLNHPELGRITVVERLAGVVIRAETAEGDARLVAVVPGEMEIIARPVAR
jgi:DNA helicase II / ATP-dependent DNA helicase PcrA